jgi:hypothetical protein
MEFGDEKLERKLITDGLEETEHKRFWRFFNLPNWGSWETKR